MTNNNHGGKRPGAGPPQIPEGEKKEHVYAYIERDFILEYGELHIEDFDGTLKSAKKKIQEDFKAWFYETMKLDFQEETT